MAALPFRFLEKLEDPSFSFPYTPCPIGWYFKIYPESSHFTATLKVPCRHHSSPGLPQQPPVRSPCSHACPTSKLFSMEVRSRHAPGQASSPITHSLKAEVIRWPTGHHLAPVTSLYPPLLLLTGHTRQAHSHLRLVPWPVPRYLTSFKSAQAPTSQ